jgi:hypothetical protein
VCNGDVTFLPEEEEEKRGRDCLLFVLAEK